jgi:hypothetical protein
MQFLGQLKMAQMRFVLQAQIFSAAFFLPGSDSRYTS